MNLNNFLHELHSNFTYSDINNFYKECRSNQILHSCDYGLKMQPTYWMYFDSYNYGYSAYSCKVMRFKGTKPNKYDIWMSVREDYTGARFNVFYPKKPKPHDNVDVLYSGCIFNGVISWEHGDRGLWDTLVYKVILIEAYYMSTNANIVEWIDRKLKTL